MARPRDISRDLERLARDICWAEFLLPEDVGTTKAIYWRNIQEDARNIFRAEARRISWLLNKLGSSRALEIVGFSCARPSPSPACEKE